MHNRGVELQFHGECIVDKNEGVRCICGRVDWETIEGSSLRCRKIVWKLRCRCCGNIIRGTYERDWDAYSVEIKGIWEGGKLLAKSIKR